MRISTCSRCSDGEEEEDCGDDDGYNDNYDVDDDAYGPVGAVQSVLVIGMTMMIMSVCR